MNYRVLVLSFWVSLILASQGAAKDLYVSQSGAGSNSGQDAADSFNLAWMNNTANWGAGTGQINPGDTVHLTGTFTSPLDVQGSGTPGNPITIFFEPGANFTTGCWPSTGAILLNSVSWVVIDGGVNGLIQNTSNGTGLTTSNNSRGIGGSGNGTGVLYNGVIQNLRITNMYTKVKGVLDPTRAGYAIDLSGSSITISNCTVSDGDGGLSYSATGVTQSNVFLLHNTVLNCNHTLVIGLANSNCYLTNLTIAGNYLDHWDVWDCPGNTPIHLDGIIIFNDAFDASSVMDGTRIYNNTFGGYVGTRTTAAIFTDFGGTIKNYYIYNNLFLCYPPGQWGNGFINAGGSNVWVVNNTCAGTYLTGTNYGGGIFGAGKEIHLYNNCMLYGSLGLGSSTSDNVNPSQSGTNDFAVVSTYLNSVWSDYNVLVNPVFQTQLVLYNTVNGNSVWVSGIIGPKLLDWQTWYENEWGIGVLPAPLVPGLYAYAQLHCDPHSVNSMPIFNPGTYVPATNDTVAVGRGTNLSFLGINTDMLGNPRTNTGRWTIGAFEVAVASSQSQGANPPTVSFTATPPGTNNVGFITLSWTTSNATNASILGIGNVPLSGSTNVLAGTTVSFSLTATGPGGSFTSVVPAPTRPPPPPAPHLIGQ